MKPNKPHGTLIMTGNNFHPEIVARIIELLQTGETDLRGTIRREYPVLTAQGIERVFDVARQEIAAPGQKSTSSQC